MHRMQEGKLSFKKEQKDFEGKAGDAKVLQTL